ncbi:MAG: FAD-dependent oxidoreductase [Solirubrobacterales bacterium]
MTQHDYDYLIIGSGFGGSTSALRLAQKGYKVAVLECGRRFADDEFADSTRKVSRYYWFPKFGMRGVFRLTLFKDILIASGSGVGGGSLGYANTLYRARPKFYEDPQIDGLADWKAELAPHYDEAERMLGVVTYDQETDADRLLEEYAESLGRGDTYAKTRVGVYLGEAGKTVPDPYFGGEGPDRTGCVRCGQCMVGCRFGAKNTLVKNYLWFAEKLGVFVSPERTAVDIKPLGSPDGSDGYVVTHEKTGSWLRRDRQRLCAKAVIVSAGALGSNKLLASCKLRGSLPRISDRLGFLVRTNSESILAVTAPDDSRNFADGVAITSSIYPDPDTHIEPVTYGQGGDSQSLLFTLLTEAGRRGTQPLHLLRNLATHPRQAVRAARIKNFSRRTMIILVMQSLDNSMRLRVKRRWPNGNVVLTTEQDPDNPNPDKLPAAYRCAEWIQSRIGGTAQVMATEASLSIPTTAHILGGAVVGSSPQTGVVDTDHRVFGYKNLLVCDGSAVPANIGANPSLTITAMTERAIAAIPAKDPGLASPVPAIPLRIPDSGR